MKPLLKFHLRLTMKIILLSGQPNTGKTTVFNDLYTTLVSSGASVHTGKTSVGGNPLDFECILSVTVTGVVKSVAIYSMGDYHESVYHAIIKYSHCDVLVLAYSDKFVRNIASFVSSLPHHVVVSKTSNNSADVATIVSHI